jgi:hypothetical protein
MTDVRPPGVSARSINRLTNTDPGDVETQWFASSKSIGNCGSSVDVHSGVIVR